MVHDCALLPPAVLLLLLYEIPDSLSTQKHEGGLYVKNGELQCDAKVYPVKNMVSSETTSTHTTEAIHRKTL